MPKAKKRSFFERLTSTGHQHEEKESTPVVQEAAPNSELWQTNFEDSDGELALDVHQTASDIIVQTFVAGVKPEDLEIHITRDMLTLRGKRMETKNVKEEDYFSKELYWGSFSRAISLPQEVEPEEAEAIERHGLLTIRMPKIDRNKHSNLKVKSL